MQAISVSEARQNFKKYFDDKENLNYLTKLEKSYKQLDEGKVIVKTMEELEAMANE